MASSPRLLSWILLCIYCTVTATEAHLSPQRRQLVFGRPSHYRPISAPTQTFNVATPAETFETPISGNRTVGRNIADIIGGFLSNTEGGGGAVKADGTENSILQSHPVDSPLDNGDAAFLGYSDGHSYKMDTGIVGGHKDNGQLGLTGHGNLGISNGFGSSLLDLFQNFGTVGAFRASHRIRESVGGSGHIRRYLPKVRYARDRRQDLSGIEGDLVDLELLGGIVGSSAPPAAPSPSTAGTSSTINDPDFEGSKAAPAAPEAASTGGTSSATSPGSQPAPAAAGAPSSPSASGSGSPTGAGREAVGSNSQVDPASSASPASTAVLGPTDDRLASPKLAGADTADATAQGAPASTDSVETEAATPTPTPSAEAPAQSAASPPTDVPGAISADANTPSTPPGAAASNGASAPPSAAKTSSDTSPSDGVTSADTTSGDRGALSTDAKAVAMLSHATGAGRTSATTRKSPRQLSRSRRGFVSLKAGPGVPIRRQLYHPRRGSESRRAGLSPRYMHRTRPYYERRQEEHTLPSQVDGDFDSDMSTLGDGISTDDVSGSLQHFLRRYLPSWMDFAKLQDGPIVPANEGVNRRRKDEDVSADIPDDGDRSVVRRFYAKVGTMQPRQLTRSRQPTRRDPATVGVEKATDRDADALADIENPPNARGNVPHPKVHLTETNTRHHGMVPSDPKRFEEESLNYNRRALPHPKGTISYHHRRRDGTVNAQWAISSSDTKHLPLSPRYPPSFRIKRKAAATDVPALGESASGTRDRRRQEAVPDVKHDVGTNGKDANTDLIAEEPRPDSAPGRSLAGPAVPRPKISVTNLNRSRAVKRQERTESVTDGLTGLLGDGISVPPDNLAAEVPPSFGSPNSSSASPAASPAPATSASNATTKDEHSAPHL